MRIYGFFFALTLFSVSPSLLAQNIGIGTNNPQQKLHVAGGAIADSITLTGGQGNIFKTRIPASETKDQAQETTTSGSTTDAVSWQSFIPSISGQLTKVELAHAAPFQDVQLTIYAGEGTAGANLGTVVYTPVQGWGSVSVSSLNVQLTKDSVYTIALSTGLAWFRSPNLYDRGKSGVGATVSTIDFAFRTFVSGASNVVINSAGRMGIGIDNPQLPLEVGGTIRAEKIKLTANAANGFVLVSNSNGDASWQAPATIGAAWAPNGINIFNTNSGNVGIGTANPTYKLQIDGPGPSFRIGGASGDYGSSILFSMAGSGEFNIDAPGTIGGRLTVKNNGNVGIGTGNPGARLQVVGTALFSGPVTVDNTLNVGGELTVASIATEAKTQLLLQNGWNSFSGFEALYCYRDKEKRVWLGGTVSRQSAASGTVIATLPVGFRPAFNKVIPVAANFTDFTSSIQIDTDGNITVSSNATRLHFDGISFRLD